MHYYFGPLMHLLSGVDTEAVAAGELLLGEAESASALVERFVRTIEAGEFEKRLRALEAAATAKR